MLALYGITFFDEEVIVGEEILQRGLIVLVFGKITLSEIGLPAIGPQNDSLVWMVFGGFHFIFFSGNFSKEIGKEEDLFDFFLFWKAKAT